MAWRQTKPFDQTKAGKVPNECLGNTRKGFSIDRGYNSAWEAWLHTEQHHFRDMPAGVDVPVYFWYKDAENGHVGVRLANGKFWTDGRIFDSVEAYEAARVPNFVGWGESINGVKVIEHTPDPVGPKMPAVGGQIQLMPVDYRTTYRAGTTTKAGTIQVKDNSYIYTVRGYDLKYPGRVIINSASAGGNGVALALYYTDGKLIPGWKAV